LTGTANARSRFRMLPDAAPKTHSPGNVSISALFWVCFWIGLFSFGGGLSAWIHREVVDRRKWLTNDEFLNGVTLGQVLPGANVTNLVVYIGQRLIGPAGAAAALVGLLLGPFLAIIGLVSLYEAFAGLAWIHRALDGAAAAALGLILVIVYKTGRHAARAWTSLLVMIATMIAVGILQWPLLPVVLGLASASIAITWFRTAE
jgi:chromate transporter